MREDAGVVGRRRGEYGGVRGRRGRGLRGRCEPGRAGSRTTRHGEAGATPPRTARRAKSMTPYPRKKPVKSPGRKGAAGGGVGGAAVSCLVKIFFMALLFAVCLQRSYAAP